MKMRGYVELVFLKDLISTVYSGNNEVLLGEATKQRMLQTKEQFEQILPRANLIKVDLHEADLRKADMSGTSLCGTDLRGANLEGVNIKIESDFCYST